jgi:predicted DNA-binding protein
MATSKILKLLLQKNDSAISVVIPLEMKQLIAKCAKDENMSESQYIKLAIIEKLDKVLK